MREDLPERVRILERQLADARAVLSRLTSPRQRVMHGLRNANSSPGLWIELTGLYDEDAGLPYVGPFAAVHDASSPFGWWRESREAWDENQPEALITLDPNVITLMESVVFVNGKAVTKYVELTRGFFPVWVYRDGGVNGTKTTKATYTYTVHEFWGGWAPGTTPPANGAGPILGTGMTPRRVRAPGALVEEASAEAMVVGLGFIARDHNTLGSGPGFFLYDANERHDAALAC